MNRTMLLMAFIAMATSALSQDLTRMRFYVKGGSDFYIKLDGELLPLANTHDLTPGTHDIQIWSPMHLTFDGKIDVPQKSEATYYQELEKDPAYVSYLFAKDRFKKQLFWGRTGPLLVAGIGIASAPLLHLYRKNVHEDLVQEEFKAQYFSGSTSTTDVNRRYAIANGMFFTSCGMAIGGTAIFFLLRNRVQALQKPEYKQQNPFTLETFELSYNPIIKAPQASIQLNF